MQVAVSLFLVFYRDGVQTKFPRSFGVFRVIIKENGVFRRDVESLAQCFINFPVRLYELTSYEMSAPSAYGRKSNVSFTRLKPNSLKFESM